MRLIRFIANFNETKLMEAARDRYMRMITSMPKLVQQSQSAMDSLDLNLNWAMDVLKREDRIIWYMRIKRIETAEAVRSNLYADKLLNKDPAVVAAIEELNNWLKKNTANLLTKMGHPGAGRDPMIQVPFIYIKGNFQQRVEHYLSLGLPQIEQIVWQYQFPDEILRAMETYEKAWKEKSKGTVADSGAKKVLEFPDGSAWFDLEKPYCPEEGEAMGHCGNAGSRDEDETVLSYRVPKQVEGRLMWQPHLTFILRKSDGSLGEMKGRGNDKPVEKYHPVIVELLRQPFIKAIHGGGYLPKNNFRLTDLTPEQQEQLLTEKPTLGGLETMMKKMGPGNPEVLAKINGYLKNLGEKPVTWDEKENGYVIAQLRDIHQFAEDFTSERGARTARSVAKALEDGESLYDFDSFHVDKNQREDILVEYSEKYKKEFTELQQYVWVTYLDYIQDNYDEGDIDSYTDLHAGYIVEITNENDDEIYDQLGYAVGDGYQRGAESEMYEAYEAWVKDPTDRDVHVVWGDDKHPQAIDTNVRVVVSMEVMAEALEEDGELENQGSWESLISEWVRDLDEPYNGWSGYDEEAALEYLDNLLEFPRVEQADLVRASQKLKDRAEGKEQIEDRNQESLDFDKPEVTFWGTGKKK